jgi:hypothetical protein
MKYSVPNLTAMLPVSFFRKVMLLSFTSLLLMASSSAQSTSRSAGSRELHNRIATFDASLFEAFNSCNLEKVGTFFTKDVEFYHEKGGLIKTRERVIAVMRQSLCSNSSNKVRRELIKISLEVHPISDYGAVQTGEHRLSDPERTGGEIGWRGQICSYVAAQKRSMENLTRNQLRLPAGRVSHLSCSNVSGAKLALRTGHY